MILVSKKCLPKS